MSSLYLSLISSLLFFFFDISIEQCFCCGFLMVVFFFFFKKAMRLFVSLLLHRLCFSLLIILIFHLQQSLFLMSDHNCTLSSEYGFTTLFYKSWLSLVRIPQVMHIGGNGFVSLSVLYSLNLLWDPWPDTGLHLLYLLCLFKEGGSKFTISYLQLLNSICFPYSSSVGQSVCQLALPPILKMPLNFAR